MATASGKQQNANLSKLQDDVDEVADLLHDNIDKVLERGDKLETMVERTDDLNEGAKQFQKTSKKVKRKYCFKNMKMTCLLIVVVVVIIAALVLVIVLVTKPWDDGGGSDPTPTPTIHYK